MPPQTPLADPERLAALAQPLADVGVDFMCS